MPAISVGQLYHPARTTWPETAQYQYRSGQHELVVFMREPTAAEVRDYRKGRARFSLVVQQPVILMLYRLGAEPWSDAPYSWHLVPEPERDLPSADLESGKRSALQVVLVEAATGIVRALRLVSWSPPFTRTLHAAIREQAAAPWDAQLYDTVLAQLMRRESAGLARVGVGCEG